MFKKTPYFNLKVICIIIYAPFKNFVEMIGPNGCWDFLRNKRLRATLFLKFKYKF